MEGPHIRWFVEQLAPFAGCTVVHAKGEAKVDHAWLVGQPLPRATSRGKLLFLPFDEQALRIHFLMFGDLRINREWPGKKLSLRLMLEPSSTSPASAKEEVLSIYMSSVKLVPLGDIERSTPARLDIMHPAWEPEAAWSLALAEHANEAVCDVLMDQTVFAGLGNKIKCEVLYRARVHPLRPVRELNKSQQEALTREIRDFCDLFYRVIDGEHSVTSRAIERHMHVYRQKQCPSGHTVVKEKLGNLGRVTFYCETCQG